MLEKLVIPAIFTWLGLIIAISFVEAPLKFQAPGITIPLGLGIGRLVFNAINKVELVLMAIAFFSAFSTNKQNGFGFYIICGLAFILLYQTLYLLPALDARAELVLKGEILPPSFHHKLYVLIETVKLIMLLVSGIYYLDKLNRKL